MRFEVKMPMTVFWVVTPCGFVVDTNVSEEGTTSVFSPEGASVFF
jgi:hypothetical protein